MKNSCDQHKKNYRLKMKTVGKKVPNKVDLIQL